MATSKRLLTACAALGLAACGEAPEAAPEPREPTAEEVAAARVFLDENNTPLPGGWTFDRIAFGDDGHLRVGRAAPPDARASILFVPGYTSSPELASDFIARWHELGFEVASVDLPGQGGSVRRSDDPQKTFTGDFSVYGAAVGAAAAWLAETRESAGPLIVAGDSLGGHAVLRAAADEALPMADGLFPLVPAVMPETGDMPLPMARLMIGLVNLTGGGEDYFDGQGPWSPDAFDPANFVACGDREDRNFKNAALFTTEPDLRVGGTTHEFALGMVMSGEKLMRDRDLRRFDRPVVMVTAGREVIVRNDVAERLCEQRMASCELVRIEEATHCLYLEDQPTQDRVHDALLRLVETIEARR